MLRDGLPPAVLIIASATLSAFRVHARPRGAHRTRRHDGLMGFMQHAERRVCSSRDPPTAVPNDRSALPGFIGERALSARSVGSWPGSRAARQPPVGSESRRSWAQSGTKSRLARSPWSPERSVQTLCRSARPASTSGFTGASSRREPRPSPSQGDALLGSAAIAKCHLSRALERTTGFEPATLTLAMCWSQSTP